VSGSVADFNSLDGSQDGGIVRYGLLLEHQYERDEITPKTQDRVFGSIEARRALHELVLKDERIQTIYCRMVTDPNFRSVLTVEPSGGFRLRPVGPVDPSNFDWLEELKVFRRYELEVERTLAAMRLTYPGLSTEIYELLLWRLAGFDATYELRWPRVAKKQIEHTFSTPPNESEVAALSRLRKEYSSLVKKIRQAKSLPKTSGGRPIDMKAIPKHVKWLFRYLATPESQETIGRTIYDNPTGEDEEGRSTVRGGLDSADELLRLHHFKLRPTGGESVTGAEVSE
jgi:hypothetical protein